MSTDLDHKYEELLAEVTSFSKVRQELVVAKQHIDRELGRYESISTFNKTALQLESYAEVITCCLESIIEGFQLELAFFIEEKDGFLEITESFGVDDDVTLSSIPSKDIDVKKTILVDGNHPLLQEIKGLDISQAIIGPVHDADQNVLALVISGITTDGADFYDKLDDNVLKGYSVMLDQVSAIHHMFFINEKLERQVKERTQEVVEQKEEITDSINYAFRIQNSILGDIDEANQLFKDSFIFFVPKDIVSGDFYWYAEVKQYKVIIAADCTGHGVPGAFMTVLGNALLNEIINENLVVDPAKILTVLDRKIRAITQKEGKEVNDGMDMSVLVFDSSYETVRFAGAKNPLVYIRKGEIFKIKGSRDAIGGSPNSMEFETHQIDYRMDDVFYIFSDGFQDQFDKNDAKKYKTKRFHEYLNSISGLSGDEQLAKLQKEFYDWKGNTRQTDDVLVIGVKT